MATLDSLFLTQIEGMSKYFWFLSFALISLPSFAQEEWKLEKDKNGIQVYTRPRAGYDIREFK